ncbi:MAG: hypothetical protein OXG24_03635 [Gammaproteobacteria bacterium]|nr:hypothetical protein [Gammaproteobacteria bacterium]
MTETQRAIVPLDECVTALRQLDDNQLRQLYELGRIRAIGIHSVDGRDLLHEAIIRMLQGKRRWPRGVPLVVFLLETMRSIASDHRRRLEDRVLVNATDVNVEPDLDENVIELAADESSNPETRTIAAEVLSHIKEAFKNDNDALAVLRGKALGKTPHEIQEENAMDGTRYATTQRRIRRRLSRLDNK